MSDGTGREPQIFPYDPGHDPVIGRWLSPVHGGRRRFRLVPMVLVLLPIAVAYVISALADGRDSRAPAALAAIGVTRGASTPADSLSCSSRTSTAAPCDSSRPLPGVCAMSYPDALQTAQIIRSFRKAPALHEEGPRAAGEILVELSHQLPSGRLIVKLDGRTILSKPFNAHDGESSGTVSHLLSVPAGRHGVQVKVLGDRGQIRGESTTTGRVRPHQIARLQAEQRRDAPDVLRLEWTKPDRPGGRVR